MNEIKNKEITIQGFELKNSRYKLTDQDNQTFGFFTTKQDGTDTHVYTQWKNMELGQGKSVNIGYVEEEFYSEKAKKNVRTKKIINFREPLQQSVPVPKGIQDAFNRRLGVQGHVNAYLHTHTVEETIRMLPSLLNLEDEISKALNGKQEVEEFPISEDDIPY